MMNYKGYFGSVEFDEEGPVFHGKLQYLRALVTYEATIAIFRFANVWGMNPKYLLRARLTCATSPSAPKGRNRCKSYRYES